MSNDNGSGLSVQGEPNNDGGIVFEQALYLDENDNVTEDESAARWLLVAAGGTLSGDLAAKYGLDGKADDKPVDDGANRVDHKKRTPANKSRTADGDK